MRETQIIIIGLVIIGVLSLYFDSSITVAIVGGLIGYLAPRQVQKDPTDKDV